LFDVDVVQILAIDNCDTQFFCLCRIDEHAFHCAFLALPCAPTPGVPASEQRNLCASAYFESFSASTPRHAAGALIRVLMKPT
jgi:hypothetical protein